MSTDNQNDSDGRPARKVTDEEGTVDQKVKNRILKARERIDETEQELYIGAAIDGSVNLTPEKQQAGYAMMVRQYIRNLKPLLTSDDVEDSEYYWANVPIFEETFHPPDKDGYNWSLFAAEELDNAALKREMGLDPGFEPPEPKTFEIRGLRDVLDTRTIELTWRFDKYAGRGVAEADIEELHINHPLPKSVYERAVERADEFLQTAGVGLEIGHRQTDEPDDDPF